MSCHEDRSQRAGPKLKVELSFIETLDHQQQARTTCKIKYIIRDVRRSEELFKRLALSPQYKYIYNINYNETRVESGRSLAAKNM